MFVTEPTTASPLFELPNVVVTPHLGASTAEAQDRAGTDVARSVLLALRGDFVPDAVNVQAGGVVGEEVRPVPAADPEARRRAVTRSAAEAAAARSPSRSRGELATEDVSVLQLAALRGVFSARGRGPGHVRQRAARSPPSWGVAVELTTEPESADHRSLVTLRAVHADGESITRSPAR